MYTLLLLDVGFVQAQENKVKLKETERNGGISEREESPDSISTAGLETSNIDPDDTVSQVSIYLTA